jgi:hypothetical protein
MKKSKYIHLALVAAVLSSCDSDNDTIGGRVLMRSDPTALYQDVTEQLYEEEEDDDDDDNGRVRTGSLIPMYLAFRSIGYLNGNSYVRSGYYSNGIGEKANLGSNSTKGSIVRGGFGGRTVGASS